MKAEALRALDKDALENKCLEIRKELFVLRMRPQEPQQKTHLVREKKRTLARVKTLLVEKERSAS